MQYLNNEISTGCAINAAFMNYAESEAVTDFMNDNLDWQAFKRDYDARY